MKHLAGLALLLWLAGCTAPPDASGWLRAAAQAERGVARSGLQRVEAWPAGRLVSADVAVACNGSGTQRREHLGGPCAGLVVLSAGSDEWRREAPGQVWTRRPRLGHGEVDLDDDDLSQIRLNYRLRLVASPNLAGRRAVRLDLSPRHGGPQRRLWLDRETGLMLACETFDRLGHLAGRVTFTQLTLAPPEADLARPANAVAEDRLPLAQLEPVASTAEQIRLIGEQLAEPTRLPAGFHVHGRYVRTARTGRLRPAWTFSDGLALVTVFDRGPGWPGQSRCRVAGEGAELVVTRTTPRREWVVVGDLDARTLTAMAQALPD